MEDVLAVTLKAKMARFNHAGVYRTNGDLMDFFPLDAIEIHDAGEGFFVLGALPGVMPGSPRGLKPHRLEPRVAFGPNAELLGDFPFEQMELRTIRRQRVESIVLHERLRKLQLAMDAIRQDDE